MLVPPRVHHSMASASISLNASPRRHAPGKIWPNFGTQSFWSLFFGGPLVWEEMTWDYSSDFMEVLHKPCKTSTQPFRNADRPMSMQALYRHLEKQRFAEMGVQNDVGEPLLNKPPFAVSSKIWVSRVLRHSDILCPIFQYSHKHRLALSTLCQLQGWWARGAFCGPALPGGWWSNQSGHQQWHQYSILVQLEGDLEYGFHHPTPNSKLIWVLAQGSSVNVMFVEDGLRGSVFDGPYHSVFGDRVTTLGKPYRFLACTWRVQPGV